MESTSISDVRRMLPARRVPGVCAGRQGILGGYRHRAKVVPLNGESGPANTGDGQYRTGRTGAAAAWSGCSVPATLGKAPTRTQTKRAVQGLLIVQCEECGAIKAFLRQA